MVSSDRRLFEAVLKAMATTWDQAQCYVFVCAGDFAQVCYPSWLLASILCYIEQPNTLFRYCPSYMKMRKVQF